MEATSLIGTIIALLTAATTYKGLTDRKYQEQYLFDVDGILIGKQYFRLITSGFLHANWIHFGFNMIALISFALSIEILLGVPNFLIIYFFSLVGGSLLSLYIHKNHGDYTAVGASGAISGIVASSIVLFPDGEISLILLPFGITSWMFGLLFIVISILGIKSQSDNIGHEAHLGGVLAGIVATVFIRPSAVIEHWWVVVLLLIPIIIFLFLIIKRPDVLITGKWTAIIPKKRRKPVSIEKNLDAILDKISKKGIDSLTIKEKEMLEKYRDEI